MGKNAPHEVADTTRSAEDLLQIVVCTYSRAPGVRIGM